jgi:hypothetical protein
VNCRGRRPGAFFIAISALVLAGFPDDQHPDVSRCDRVERLALRREDLAVRFQQVLALHSGAARAGADEQCDTHVLECNHRIGRGCHPGEQREPAVVELHHHAAQRLLRFLVRNLEQLQDHRLILAEHLAARDPEQQGIADLPGSAGDRDSNRGFGHGGLRDKPDGKKILP